MDLILDEPITSATEDCYGRAVLARHCADTLMSIKSNSAFVVGLSGTWGSGKTSFINLVREQIRLTDSNLDVLDFNPWLYTSYEQLVREFFEQLRSSRTIDKVSDLGKALKQYSETIAGAGVSTASMLVPQVAALNAAIPFASTFEKFVISRALKRMGELAAPDDKTLVQLKDEIRADLARREGNIIVLIDDVDRLSSEEICLLFKLVNNVASFPRMTFLLSYDTEVVTPALSQVQGMNGALYLEKIVQLPIALPPLTKDDVRNQLSVRLDAYIDTQQTFSVEADERSRMLRVFEGLVLGFVSSPRRLKRYLNQFEVAAFNAGGEICPTDTIGMVGLSQFCPCTMRWIVDHRDDICTGGSLWQPAGSLYYQSLNESLSCAIARDVGDSDSVREALCLLFPRIDRLASEQEYAPVPVARETGRVANLDNLELFLGVIDGLAVSRETLYCLMKDADADELSKELDMLYRDGQLERFSDFVLAERRAIDNRRRETICRAILQAIGGFTPEEDSFFSLSADHKVSILLVELMRAVGVERADAVMMESLEDYSPEDFIGLGWFLRDERLAQLGSGGICCLSAEVYEQVSRRYVETLVDSWPHVLRMSHLSSRFLWKVLDADVGGGALREVQRLYNDRVDMRVLCKANELSHWLSDCGAGYSWERVNDRAYQPVLSDPTIQEVRAYGESSDYALLPDDIRTRVAALYILLGKDADRCTEVDGDEVTSDAARRVVSEWLANGST